MREIKFRAWNRLTKKMIENPLCNSGWLNDMFKNQLGENTGTDYMQFTGLKDKNGKEIYEGDILSTPNKVKTIEVVSFDYSAFVVKGYNHAKQRKYKTVISPAHLERREIIGNIYENPELLT